ncbi:MAG: LysR family transcriptional regulator [Promethearchaeota archaeon]
MKVDVPYSRLQTFYHVAINKSFKKAARNLSVTEGAISQQIKDLEGRLGRQLFERSSRAVALTPNGSNLLHLVAPIVEKVDSVVDEFEEITGSLRGKVKIASFEAMLLYVFPKYLEKFRKTYPECELLLFNVSGMQIRSMVLSGVVDFGVASVEDLPSGIVGQEVWTYKRYFIAPKGHPLSKKRRLTLQDFAQYPLVMPDEAGAAGRFLVNVMESHNPNLQVTVQAGGWQVVMKYVELGFGISVLPGIALQPKDKSRFYLRPLSDIGDALGYSRYGILLKKGKYLSPATRELIRFFSPDFNFGNH